VREREKGRERRRVGRREGGRVKGKKGREAFRVAWGMIRCGGQSMAFRVAWGMIRCGGQSMREGGEGGIQSSMGNDDKVWGPVSERGWGVSVGVIQNDNVYYLH
jgi:hypothetical protein